MSVAVRHASGRWFPIAIVAIAGALFGAGLVVAGMTLPTRVVGFLDVTRNWDPSLAFVIGGAVAIYAIALRVIHARREGPWFDRSFHLPARRDLDSSLIAGAAIFGVGWGLGGFCPGPGLVAAASGSGTAIAFVVAMFVGMYAHYRSKR